jgi:hypothetical protein
MATVTGIKISRLPAADAPLSGTEQVPIVQTGTTKRTTVDAIREAALAGPIVWAGAAFVALGAGPINNEATDIAAVSRLAVTLTGDTDLGGKTGGADGKVISIQNRDLVDTLTILNEAAGSTAANRFAINGDLIVPPRCGALFIYDGVIQRWVKQ